MDRSQNDSYKKYPIQRVLTIEQVVTIHYLSGIHDFATQPEAHDFWELIYLDYGEAELIAGDSRLTLRGKQLFLHSPNETHAFSVGHSPAAIFALSFVCDDACLLPLRGHPLSSNLITEKLIPLLVEEVQRAFEADDGQQIMLRDLNPRQATPFGAEQMLSSYLEQLLIHLVRLNNSRTEIAVDKRQSDADNRVVREVLNYIHEHLSEDISVPLLAGHVSYSRAYLSEIFQSCVGMGLMEYVEHERIRRAKQMLAENTLTVTDIAAQLGFSSVHYFSRRFRLKTGCSPRHYAASLQSKLMHLNEEETAPESPASV